MGGVLVVAALIVVRGAAPPDIVVIVVDCLRRDHVGTYGYGRDTTPVLDALAQRGTVFTRAYSTAAWTKPAVASLLSGRYPHRHRVVAAGDSLPPQLPTLAEALAARGYATVFVNGGNAFVGERFGFHRGFTAALDLASYDGRHAVAAAASELAALPHTQPRFTYVHLMDAHLPYHRNRFNTRYTQPVTRPSHWQPGRIQVGPVREATAAGRMPADARQRLVDLYDGQVRWADAQVGVLLEQLEAAGRLARTVVIVTADHGEEFWEHGNYEHGHSFYEEVVGVPLIVAGPGIPAARVTAPVSLVDVYATVRRLAGLQPDAGADGIDLFAAAGSAHAAARPERELALFGTLYGPTKAGIVTASRKWIVTQRGPKQPGTTAGRAGWRLVGAAATAAVELYDLAVDPSEQYNLAAEHTGSALVGGASAVVQATGAATASAGPQVALLRRLHSWFAAGTQLGDRSIAPDVQRRLRALGYLQ